MNLLREVEEKTEGGVGDERKRKEKRDGGRKEREQEEAGRECKKAEREERCGKNGGGSIEK